MELTLQQKVQEILEQSVSAGEAACFSVLIRQHDQELLYAQAGWLDIEAHKPVARDSIFRIYSQSKPITAAAAMILLERGAIDLLDPVSKYLPGFTHPSIMTERGLMPVAAPTLYQLLSMTSGAVYPGTATAAELAVDKLFTENTALMAEGKGMDTVTLCNRIGECPLAFEPGTHFKYGTSADILGAVIEVASGMKFGDFLQKELFEPLGMKDTAFHVPPEKRERLVHTYTMENSELTKWDGTHLCVGIPDERPPFESGGAGIFSTLDDYAGFAQMLLNGGVWNGKRIMAERTVRMMTSAQLRPHMIDELTGTWASLAGYSYGHLMRVCQAPGAAVCLAAEGEYGWDGWLGTYFGNLPREEMTILLMTNRRMNAEQKNVLRRVRNLVLSSMDS